MISCCTKYFATMPNITIYAGCDTPLALNLNMFELGDNDELIFVIKNYDYIGSPYVFLFKARKGDEDENGEVFFKISPNEAERIKYGAFYNIAVLENAFNADKEPCYKKLTENGKIVLEYGAQDLAVDSVGNPSEAIGESTGTGNESLKQV